MSIWGEAAQIISTFLSGDAFMMKTAFRTNGAWLIFGPLTVLGGFLIAKLYQRVPWIDRNLEKTVVVYTYIIIAAIIFVGVLQRFLPFLSGQPPWSTTVPPMLFMVMAWFGCSYNVGLRSHLSFDEFRKKLPRPLQMATLWLDAVLWMIFCIVVVTTTSRVTVNSVANFQIVPGTDNLMQWWFIITVPFAFILMAARVIQNLQQDLRNYREGEDLIIQSVIGGDNTI